MRAPDGPPAGKTTKRRAILLAGLALPSIVWAATEAVPTARMPFRIGWVGISAKLSELTSGSPAAPAARIVEQGLRERGWIHGENIEFVWRSGEGRWDRLGPILDELIAMPVDVLVVFSFAVFEAIKRTSTIPIVMGGAAVFPDTRRAPAGPVPANLTGMTASASSQLYGKRLALLKSLSPGLLRVAFAYDRQLKFDWKKPGATTEAAKALQLTLVPAPYDQTDPASGLDLAFEQGARAVLFFDNAGAQRPENQAPLHEWTRRRRIPALHCFPNAVETGGLMYYGTDPALVFRRIAYFIDRILRGTKPSDIPIEEPSVFRLVINLRAAKAIGLTVPQELLLQADRVIE